MKTIRLTGKKQADYAAKLINECLDKPELWCVDIAPESQKRTDKQNRLMHALFADISKEAANVGKGETATNTGWKYFFKSEFLPSRTEYVGGKFISIPTSTAKLNKKQCSDFVKEILRWCLSVGIDIKMKTNDYEFLVMMK